MRIDTILQRWIDVLTALFFTWRESLRARRSLVISCSGERFIVHKVEPDRDAIIRLDEEEENDDVLAVLAPGGSVPPAVTRAAHNGFVILELPDHNVVVRRISVPVQARDFLSGVVRNQIERLSPWQAEQAVYGFDAHVNPDDAANLDVRVFIASRAVVDSARDALTAIGLAVDRVVTRQRGGEDAAPVTLWSRLADVTREDRDQVRLRLAVGLAAFAVISLGSSLWAVFSAASIRDDSEELATRIKALQRQVQGPRSPQAVALLSPPDRAWYAKETSPSAVIVLEAVSRALPDSAYLTELHLENGTLRIDGLANDAPALLAPLEHSGHLVDVRFFAPTTRGTDGTLFRFHIEARVEPHFKIAED